MAPPVPGAGSHVRAGPAPPILDLLGALELSLSRGRRGGGGWAGQHTFREPAEPLAHLGWPLFQAPHPTPCALRLEVTEGAQLQVHPGGAVPSHCHSL